MAQEADVNYLTIEALEDGMQVSITTDCDYSLDGKNWKSVGPNELTQPVNAGEHIYFKRNADPVANVGVGTFTITKPCNLSGNINSMMFGDAADEVFSLVGKDWGFYKLFYECTNIIDASRLILPNVILVYGGYSRLFSGCTSLVAAPELPGIILATFCYNEMFKTCTSLKAAPNLPAKKLYEKCYSSMFYGCTSLEIAPKITATEMGAYSCQYMFQGCTSLEIAPELQALQLDIYCYRYMFQGCTSLKAAPELPAISLFTGCYQYMFQNCKKLSYIKALFTTSPTSYTSYWVDGVASTGTFVKNAAATWYSIGISGIPSGWQVLTEEVGS